MSIDLEKLATKIRQMLSEQPVTDINVIVRDREIFASAKPSRPEEEHWRCLGLHLRLE